MKVSPIADLGFVLIARDAYAKPESSIAGQRRTRELQASRDPGAAGVCPISVETASAPWPSRRPHPQADPAAIRKSQVFHSQYLGRIAAATLTAKLKMDARYSG